jgi:hypothetical protein
MPVDIQNIATNKSTLYQQGQTFRQLIKVEYVLKHADFYATDRNENAILLKALIFLLEFR